MKKSHSFRKKKLLPLTSIASFLFLFSCSEDKYEENVSILETTRFSESTSSSSVKLTVPNGNMTASATYSSTYEAVNTNDDDYNTRWRADGSAINLIADLGATQSVDYIKVSHSSGTSKIYSFEVWTRETSSTSWVSHGRYISPGNTSSTVTYDINDVSARYVRLKCNGNNFDNRNEVKKFEVWGSNDSPISNNDEGDYSSSGSISTNDGTYDLSGYDIESSSHLISSTSKTTTTEPDATDTSVFSDYFYKSSGYYHLKSAPYDGKRTEWKESTERPLTSSKTLKYEAKVTRIPENGVTIAQVHNRGGVNRPYIRVYIEDDHIHIKETTNSLTNSTGTYKTYPEDDENGNTDDIAYNEGDKFKVQMKMGSGKVNIMIETSSYSYEVNLTPSILPSSYKEDFYFKAGVYTEGNNTEPVIRFYSFED